MPRSNCSCKPSTHTPFSCHCENIPYSTSCIIPHGHTGSVRIFSISGEVCGVGIEQLVSSGGTRMVRLPNGKCQMVCLHTKKNWFSYKDVQRCKTAPCSVPAIRPWLLSPLQDCEIVLPAGCFRFVAYDSNYDLVVPGPHDIHMLCTVEPN